MTDLLGPGGESITDQLQTALHEQAQHDVDADMARYFAERDAYHCEYCGSRYQSQSAADACCQD